MKALSSLIIAKYPFALMKCSRAPPLVCCSCNFSVQRKNVKSVKVAGKVVTAEGELDFAYADSSYTVDGKAYSSRNAIKAALGKVTFSGCEMTIEFAHRPYGF